MLHPRALRRECACLHLIQRRGRHRVPALRQRNRSGQLPFWPTGSELFGELTMAEREAAGKMTSEGATSSCDRHCEPTGRRETSPDDRPREAIQLFFLLSDGLLRFARNDVMIQLRNLAACFARGLACSFRPPHQRARGCRASDAPDSRVCRGSGRGHTR